MFKKYSQEELKFLNSSDIIQVASSIGIELEPAVDRHGSQRAKGTNGKLSLNSSMNRFWDFERETGGYPIDFLMTWGGKTFTESVQYLQENDFSKNTSTPNRSKQTFERKPFVYDFQISPDKSNLKNYLVNERKVSSKLVDKLLQARLIDQDVRGNILFHYKKGRKVVGAAKNGTYIKYDENGKKITFKGIAPNSEPHFGFHFSFGKPTKLYIQEAPIDAFSFFTLNPNARRDVMYGSTIGVKHETVANFVKYAQSNGYTDIVRDGIFIGTDNDFAGIKFWSHYAKINTFTEAGNHYPKSVPEFFNIKSLFRNNIPDFYSVPKEIISMYQESMEALGAHFDLKPLLAVHKYETNFSFEKRLANEDGYFKFFGERPQREPTHVSIEEMREMIHSFVSSYVENGQDLAKTIYNPVFKGRENENFVAIAKELGIEYQDKLVVKNREEIVKDWNDVLQKKVQQINTPIINVSNTKELGHALENFDYNQIAKQDLKAAGITNRAEAMAFTPPPEAEMSL